eukprot:403371706
MNILYYPENSIMLPDCDDSENSDEDHYISIGVESNRKGHMIDVYVSLISDVQSKMIININQFEKMSTFLLYLNENLEQKYEYLRGLSGLQAVELKKVQLNLKKQNSVSNILKNPQVLVPIEGRIQDHLKPHDHILCDIESNDLWIKFNIQMDSFVTQIDVELELKVFRDMTGTQFTHTIQKLCIQLWKQFSTEQKKMKEHRFVLTHFKIEIDKRSFQNVGRIERLNTLSPQKISRSNRKKSSKQFLHEGYSPEDELKDIFQSFDNNFVKVKCEFQSIRWIYQEQFPPISSQSEADTKDQSKKQRRKSKNVRKLSQLKGQSDQNNMFENLKTEGLEHQNSLPKNNNIFNHTARLPNYIDNIQKPTYDLYNSSGQGKSSIKEDQIQQSYMQNFRANSAILPNSYDFESRETIMINKGSFKQDIFHDNSIKKFTPKPSIIQPKPVEQAKQLVKINAYFGNLLLPRKYVINNNTDDSLNHDTSNTFELDILQTTEGKEDYGFQIYSKNRLDQIQEEDDLQSLNETSAPTSPSMRDSDYLNHNQINNKYRRASQNYGSNNSSPFGSGQKLRIKNQVYTSQIDNRNYQQQNYTIKIQPINTSIDTSLTSREENSRLNSNSQEDEENHPQFNKSIEKLQEEVEARISISHQAMRQMQQSFKSNSRNSDDLKLPLLSSGNIKDFKSKPQLFDEDNILTRFQQRDMTVRNNKDQKKKSFLKGNNSSNNLLDTLQLEQQQNSLNSKKIEELKSATSKSNGSKSQNKDLQTSQQNVQSLKKGGGSGIFGNIMNIIRGTPRNQINQKKNFNFQENQIDLADEEICQKITLPAFLLTYEEFQLIKIPAMKNFEYKERTLGERTQSEFDSFMQQNEISVMQKTKKRNIMLIIAIIFLAAGLSVGIYFLTKL